MKILGKLVHKDYWNDHLVEIKDNGDYRSLYFASHILQSRMSLASPHRLVLSYTQYMLLSILFNPPPKSVLIVGIGSGSFVRFLHHHFPACKIDAVDYSHHIIDVARGYFQLPENENVAVHCLDGFAFLQNNGTIKREKEYDLILVDAFDDKGMAPTIYSEKFFRLCARSISSKGVVSCNTWSGNKKFLKKIRTILTDSFTGQIHLPIPGMGNIIVLSMGEEVAWDTICLKKNALKTRTEQFDLDFKKMVHIAKQNNLTLAQRIHSVLK